MTNNDDNFDDIDLNELFNDFDPSPSLSLPRSPLKDSSRSKSSDEMTEFHETDCTAPRVPPHNRKMLKAKKKKKSTAKQTTMYDYASTVSYKHQEFYSSLDNSTTMKTITRGQKRFSRVFDVDEKRKSMVNFLFRIIPNRIRSETKQSIVQI